MLHQVLAVFLRAHVLGGQRISARAACSEMNVTE